MQSSDSLSGEEGLSCVKMQGIWLLNFGPVWTQTGIMLSFVVILSFGI